MIDLNALAHSHDVLEIIHLDGMPCVRKTFAVNAARAARNVRKQQSFKALHTGYTRIAAAEVLAYTETGDSAELTMPYIEGIAGPMFAVHASHLIAQTLSDALSTLIYSELSRSIDTECETALILKKAEQVSAIVENTGLRTLAHEVIEKIRALPPTLVFPLGPCHGDLTLSNVILNPVSGITVIDFLDTFLETPLQDIAKLKQDFVYGWSFRNCAPTLRVKAEILCQHHVPKALDQVERMYGPQVRVLTLLALLRIAPYVRDEETTAWLVASLKNCLKIDLI
jgi:aminoglycoside phosphotransferase